MNDYEAENNGQIEEIEDVKVICGMCRFAIKSIHSSYYGGNGYHCKFGLIPSHIVLDENGTCMNGQFKDGL